MKRHWLVWTAAWCLLVAGCSGDKDDPSVEPSTAAAKTTDAPSAGPSASTQAAPKLKPRNAAPQGPPGKVRLVEVAKAEQPVGMAVRKGDDSLYVIEQPGRVKAIRDGELEPVLDITSRVGSGGERGLLGIAFSPDGKWLYLDYTGKDGHTKVVEYPVGGDGSVDADARRIVLEQEQPFPNHNGGQLAFGPDGFLYIALGDGGSGGDPQGNGQKLSTLLGKILRIDPRGGKPYRVPADNPFVKREGAKPEIWAYGLRNPWRFSFDSATGDLWIGDVGQNEWEEVDYQPADSKGGENYGWNAREAKHKFQSDDEVGIEPVHEFRLREGNTCSVIGGFVYRGTELVNMEGRYVFADFCAGWVKALTLENGKVTQQHTLLEGLDSVAAFGQDHDGELYVLSLSSGTVSKLAK